MLSHIVLLQGVLLQGLLIPAASAGGFPFFQKVPVEYISPREHPHPECPPNTHVLGHGIAPSVEEARKGARADVIRQVRSSISSLAERVSIAEQAGKHNTSSTTLKNTITEESDFSYAEKIHDIGKTYKKKRNHYALACLAKEETALYIHDQIQERMNRINNVLETGHQFFLEEDHIGFTAEYPKTQKLYQELEADLLLIRTLYDVPAVTNIVAKHNRFQKEADELASKLRLGVFSNHAPSQAQLLSLITKNNITSFATEDSCVNDQTHHASITIIPDCQTKMGNHFCSVNISYSIIDCKQNKEFLQEFTNSIVGADSRSKKRALDSTYKKIQVLEYVDQIQESLRIFTPFLQE